MHENGPVVLYVEDDADYRDMVGAILETNGYRMIGAATAEDGTSSWRLPGCPGSSTGSE